MSTQQNWWISEATGDELAGNGAAHVFYEKLFVGVGDPDSWEKGDEVGSVSGVYVITPDGKAVGSYTLWIGDDDSLNVSGNLAHDSGIKNGVVGVTGGTGSFKGQTGQVDVDWRNPHRWTLVGP